MNRKERAAYELGLKMGRIMEVTEQAMRADRRNRIISGIIGIVVGTAGPVLIANRVAKWYRD